MGWLRRSLIYAAVQCFAIGFSLFPFLFQGVDTGIQNWGPSVLAPYFVEVSDVEPCIAFQVWALLQLLTGVLMMTTTCAYTVLMDWKLCQRVDVSDRMSSTPIVYSIPIKAHGKDACSFCLRECRDYDRVVLRSECVMFHRDCLPKWVETGELPLLARGGDVEAGLQDPSLGTCSSLRLYPEDPHVQDRVEKDSK